MITKKATGGMNMNRLSKQCMVFIAGMISFLYVLGLVGHQDYIEEILYGTEAGKRVKIGDCC